MNSTDRLVLMTESDKIALDSLTSLFEMGKLTTGSSLANAAAIINLKRISSRYTGGMTGEEVAEYIFDDLVSLGVLPGDPVTEAERYTAESAR